MLSFWLGDILLHAGLCFGGYCERFLHNSRGEGKFFFMKKALTKLSGYATMLLVLENADLENWKDVSARFEST